MISKGVLTDAGLMALQDAPLPTYGSRFQPISHYDFAKLMKGAFDTLKLPHANPCYETYREGSDFAATWEVGPAAGGIYPSIGLLTSNARRFSPRLYVGGVVAYPKQPHQRDCSIVTTEIPLNVKMSKGTVMKTAVLTGVAQAAPHIKLLSARVAALAAYRASAGFASKMLWQAARLRLLAWSRLAVVDAHFVQLKPENQTAWELYKATSRAIRKYNHPFLQMRQLVAFYDMVRNAINSKG